MKILFCIGSLEKGGAERVISNLANSFVLNNVVSIVTTTEKKIEYDLDENIKLYCLNDKKSNLSKIKGIKKLYKLIKKIEPDVIVSFLPSPSYRVLLLRKFINIPIIVSVRNDPKVEYKGFTSKLIMKILYSFADGFVFQTQEAKKFFNKKIQTKSTVIANPIKKEFLERKKYIYEKENIIVSVGRLEEQKNHELLIDAFYKINEKIEDYKLIIYGEGSLRNKLEKKIKNLKMQDRILLPGVVDNIEEKIERAKLFVLPSNYEGMPNALMEAMALRTLCISTDCPCGGPRFLIKNNKSGFLFEVQRIDELCSLMKKVLLELNQNQINEIVVNARNVVQELREENINFIWYDYILKIVNNKNTREERNEKG